MIITSIETPEILNRDKDCMERYYNAAGNVSPVLLTGVTSIVKHCKSRLNSNSKVVKDSFRFQYRRQKC